MSKLKNTKRTLQSKIEAIKKINDNPKKSYEDVSDKYLNELPSINDFIGQKATALSEKRKKKKENKKDIFSELIEIVEQFMGTDKKSKNSETQSLQSTTTVNPTKNKIKTKLKQNAISAIDITLGSAKEIIIKNLSEALFMGEGICGSESIFNVDTITLSPDEFDFLNMLTIDPASTCGQIVYEPESPNKNKQKVNRELYKAFSSGPYTFTSNNSKDLFTATWDTGNQYYIITGLSGTTGYTTVQNFISDYYTSMEFPDIDQIIKTAMFLTTNGGVNCGDSKKFNISLNNVLRLINKLTTICGSPNKEELKTQDPVGMFNETDEDIESYFDFDDVEGIDLDEEDARYRKVLRFKDCDNFEIPVDNLFIEDFLYLMNNENAKAAIDNVLDTVALDAKQQSNSSLSQEEFLSDLLNSFILNLPKALIFSILSAKLFLPLVILYKIFKNALAKLDIKDLIKKFYKAIYKSIKELFWIFIKEFWRLIKIDLLAFVSQLVAQIFKNKYKRYLTIITSLISLLKKLLETDIDNCYALFQTILNTITKALSAKTPVTVPSILLMMSGSLPGYSQDRAYMNIMERLEAAGIPTGQIYGESNDIGSLIKSVIDGNTEEEDANSFIKIVLNPTVLPTAVAGTVISPGMVSGVGKKF